MKNLQTLKKFAAIVVSAMMVLSTLALPTFAAAEDGDMTINGVESNATVKGYKVVYQDTDTQWKMTKAFGEYKNDKWYVKGTDIEYKVDDETWTPDQTVLAALAALASDDLTFEKNETDGNGIITFTGDENGYVKTGTEKGSWLVLVTPAAPGTIYNPMIVSRDYKKGGTVESTANAKQSSIPFEKVVERQEGKGEPTNVQNGSVTGDGLGKDDDASATNGDFDAQGVKDGNKGDTAGSTSGTVTLKDDGTVEFSDTKQSFDDVAFRINTKLPAYADNYFKVKKEDGKPDTYPETVGDFYNPKFVVTDELSDGLTFKEGSIVVKVNDKIVAASETLEKLDDTFKIEYNKEYGKDDDKSERDFVITFAPAFIKAHKGEAVEICYSATLNKDHGVNFDQETNTAKLYYNNAPGEDCDKMEERETYHYTFTINGKLEGDGSDENREVIKVGIDEEGNRVMQETVCVTTKKGWKPLKGVEFDLHKGTEDGEVVKKVITDKDGILRGMDQIDAGVYYLKETSVGPNTEYAKDTTAIKIEITPTLDEKGRMTAYQVTVNDKIVVGNYVKDWSVDNPVATTVLNAQKTVNTSPSTLTYTYTDNDSEAADIVNTKVGTLPSTGGMGTVLFTVGGIAIMALAIFLLFGGKKKQEQE